MTEHRRSRDLRLPRRVLLVLALVTLAAFATVPAAAAAVPPPTVAEPPPSCSLVYDFAGRVSAAESHVCSDAWMAGTSLAIGQRPLRQLVLPAAHDAGTFNMWLSFWRNRKLCSGPFDFDPITCKGEDSQFITQQADFRSMLWLGIRVFDIRAAWDRGDSGELDYYLHHGVGFTEVTLPHSWDLMNKFVSDPQYEKEIVFLDHSAELGPNPHPEDTDRAKFNVACASFRETLGKYLITPAIIQEHFPGRSLPDITPNELWSLPGKPRVISNWSACLGTDAFTGSLYDKTGYLAGNCYAEPLGPQKGIKESILTALTARTKGEGEVPTSVATGFYTLGVYGSISASCAILNPNALAIQQNFVLPSLISAWDNLERNARQNLNIVSGDYVEKTRGVLSQTIDLARKVIPLNHGPLILVTRDEDAPQGAQRITFDCVPWDRTSGGSALPAGKTNTVSRLTVTGAVAESVSDSPTLTVDVTADPPATRLLVECVETSGALARLNLDVVAPKVTAVPAPAANATGWNAGDVTVDLTAVDNTGGAGLDFLKYRAEGATTIPDRFNTAGAASIELGSEGVTTVTYSAFDRAGNRTGDRILTVRIDKTNPVITASAKTTDGTPYTPGTWTNQNVTVTFACTDALSGVASVTPPATFTTSFADRTGSCSDRAGNLVTLAFGSINIDKTAPVITASAKTADGSPYTPGTWTNQSVTVTFACTDELSGVAGVTPPGTFILGLPDRSLPGSCIDRAGNLSHLVFDDIDIDKSAPVIFASARTADGRPYLPGGWTTQAVTVTFDCADGASGLKSVAPPVTVTTEGEDQSVTGTCDDNAGNSASATFGDIDIDATPPTTTATLDPAEPDGENSWYVSPVTVTLEADDAERSGVASTDYRVDRGEWTAYTEPFTVSEDGEHSVDYRSTDEAGNIEEAKSVSIRIDATPPTLSCNASPNRLWPPNHKLVTITVAVELADATSGPGGFELASVTSDEPDEGTGEEDVPDDIQGWSVGTPDTSGTLRAERADGGVGRVYTITYTGKDQAGNTTMCSATVTVPKSLQG